MFDLLTGAETQITTNTSSQLYPVIYGNKIVWEDNRNGNVDIYMFDLFTGAETQITTNTSDQFYSVIYGNKVVWGDYRNVNTDIYMYDLFTGAETRITTNTSDQYNLGVYGNKIVWQDFRNVNTDIYMYDLPTAVRSMAAAAGWDSGPNNWDWSGTKLGVGDFNGDGLDDLVAFYGYSSQRRTKAWVFLNDGIGGYDDPVVWWDSGPNNWDWSGTKLGVGDLDGDGLDDLVAFYGYSSQRRTKAWVFTSNGNNFDNPNTWWDSGQGNWDWEGTKLEVGDFNGDGIADLVAFYGYSAQRQTRAWVFTSNGAVFANPSTWWDSGPNNWDSIGTKLISGDYNADGLTDLVAFYGYSAQRQTKSWVLASNGAGFAAPNIWWDSGVGNWDWSGSSLLSGDYNGDGQTDLGVFYGYANAQSKIWIFNSEAANFAVPYQAWDSGVGNWQAAATLTASGNFDPDMLSDIVGFYGYATQRQVRAFNLN